jgi:excisionase family DNA binding protein
MSNRLLTYRDVSERWQLPLNTLRNWVMKKKLIPVKFGRLVRFPESYIVELERKGVQ